MGWVDASIRSLSPYPMFLSAAWAATRPNVTKSFSLGAERLRVASLRAIRGLIAADLDGREQDPVPEEDERLRRTAQAIHCASPRVFLVIQAWAILARRQRLPGTGSEEPPARRGVPVWQEGVVTGPRSVSSEAEALLDDATVALRVALAPPALQAAAVWPYVLERAWRDLHRIASRPGWAAATMELRRLTSEVLRSLPHPMTLQWDVLARRGLTEDRRRALADHLSALAASMPAFLLSASYLADWLDAADAPPDW
jgi:hypothetical protein